MESVYITHLFIINNLECQCQQHWKLPSVKKVPPSFIFHNQHVNKQIQTKESRTDQKKQK